MRRREAINTNPPGTIKRERARNWFLVSFAIASEQCGVRWRLNPLILGLLKFGWFKDQKVELAEHLCGCNFLIADISSFKNDMTES